MGARILIEPRPPPRPPPRPAPSPPPGPPPDPLVVACGGFLFFVVIFILWWLGAFKERPDQQPPAREFADAPARARVVAPEPVQRFEWAARAAVPAPTYVAPLPISRPERTREWNSSSWFPSEFNEARMEARNFREFRDKAFQASKSAYNRGERSLARGLADQRRDYDQKMRAADKRAVKVLMDAQRAQGDSRLDLHGLFKHEAIEETRKFIERNQGVRRQVEVITGAGNHSKGQRSVLRPAIQELCLQEGWEYEDANEGSFMITVPWW
eukprot:m.11784 g.11784  ORF g.11784 m.11784 type:complete len:269 (+) comp16339_c0_seq1:1009-1815(+)